MEQKIKSITEAFSMQPEKKEISWSWQIGEDSSEKIKQHFFKEIKLESVNIDGNPYDVYVGYDYNEK